MNKKSGKSPVLPILGVVVLSFCLLFALSVLKIESFTWAFEMIVLVAAVAAVYYILRGYSEYCCDIVGETLVFKQKMGKSERFVFSVELSHIRRLVPQNNIEREAANLGVTAPAKYYTASATRPLWGLVYYDGTYKCEKILTFAPSEQLLEVLSKKTIDNQG